MIHVAEDSFGRLDVLFNNAGIMDSADGDAVDTADDVWERTLAINLKKYVSAYSRGLSGSAKFRQQALESSGADEILELTRNYFAVVKRTPALRDEERAA